MWVGQQLAVQYSNATVEDQANIKNKIIEYGKKLSPTNRESFIKAFGTLAGVSLDAIIQEIEESSLDSFRKSTKPDNFGIWMNMSKNGKNPDWRRISNVIMEHVRDVILDDNSGEENIQRNIIVRLSTVAETKECMISMTDFIDDRKLRHAITLYMGAANTLIEPHMEGQFRNSMVALSEKNMANKQELKQHESLVYLNTGWIDNKFYAPNGYIDENGFHPLDDIKVELPSNVPYFKNYYLDEAPSDMEPIKEFIRNDLLQVFPYQVTLPYLAHVFWTVISALIPMAKPYCLWVVGQTGSFKTTYTGIMCSFFGDFKQADFETWRSTPSAIEQNGYYVKDFLYVLDDYKPVDIKLPEVTRIIQNYGDRHGRGRMRMGEKRNNLTDRIYVVRGNMVVTAEDVPPEGETSIPARTLELRIPSNGDPMKLTNAQIGYKMLPGVMTKFITFLCNKHLDSSYYERLLAERRQRFNSALHARVRENLASNSIAWDLVAEFFGFEDLTPLYNEGIDAILMNMNSATKSQQAGEVFVECIRTLLATGAHYLEGINSYESTPHIENAKKIGWIDEKGVYLIGQEALAEVNKIKQSSSGSSLNYSLRTIYDQLIASNKLIPDAKGKASKNKRIGTYQYRIVEFRRGVFETLNNETSRDIIEPQTSVVRDSRLNSSD